MILFGWWSDKSDDLLLSFYGYNFDGMNETEYYQNVKPEYLQKAKEIVNSNGGIDWPLRVMFSYVYYLPYIFIVHLIILIINKRTKK